MRLRVRDGARPTGRWRAAVERGVNSMGGPDLQVVAADDFDGAVRELTGSTTYAADRGTGGQCVREHVQQQGRPASARARGCLELPERAEDVDVDIRSGQRPSR